MRSRSLPLSRPRPLKLERLEDRFAPADVSAPVILQFFDGSYATLERRVPDFFSAGYGAVWLPPPGRADTSDFSVGYDVYDRFELGVPGRGTLYGSETGLVTLNRELRLAGANIYADLIWNHNGYSELSTPGFVNAGGYPGFLITSPTDIDGDFHSKFETGVIKGRLAGLIDIAQDKNFVFTRSPVPGAANNLPAGTTPAFGRLANVPSDANRRYYPDLDLPPIVVNDPALNLFNVPLHPFNSANGMAGDPVQENALGYLMRNARWMIQEVGFDGFRLDAVKHFEPWVLNYLDLAVFRANPRLRLDGSVNHVFSFGEVFDGNRALQQSYIRKNINPNNLSQVGGNRDVLDFPLFFALQSNLTGNGLQNDWRNVVNASQDQFDDGLANNGSQGVAFARSHDSGPTALDNVAHAYILMRPGNAVVYMNARQFGERDFPKDGRGDSLGGLYGNTITRLVQIRNGWGRGNYLPRLTEKESLIFERENSALVVLSNRTDGGFDSRTVQTAFAPGTRLIELTGNAADPIVDPLNDFPEMLEVMADGKVNLRVPRNRAPGANGQFHGRGYFVYGVAAPGGSISISGASATLAPDTPTPATNGTALLTPIAVITGDSFQVRLDTEPGLLLGLFRDKSADGDNALIRIDGGIDLNGNGKVDFTTPGTVSYGFEQFTTSKSPGFFNADGKGVYVQEIDAKALSEGVHYVTVRAFRQRPGGPAVFQDFTRVIYVDRQVPPSSLQSFAPTNGTAPENRTAIVRFGDRTGNNVHVLLNRPAALTDAQILAQLGPDTQATSMDRDRFDRAFTNLTSGNHVLTVVTFERTGNYSIVRYPGRAVQGKFGAGLGDLDFNGVYAANDVVLFRSAMQSKNTAFNPAGDLNGDGRIDATDLLLLYPRMKSVDAPAAVFTSYQTMLGPSLNGFTIGGGNSVNLASNQPVADGPALTYSWDINNAGTFTTGGAAATLTWAELNAFGVTGPGQFPVRLRVSDGTTATTLDPVPLTVVAPPAVTEVRVNAGGPSRSMVRSLTVTFNGIMLLGPGQVFEVRDAAGAARPFTTTAAIVNGQTAVTLTFTGADLQNGSLPDGRYALRVFGDQVRETTLNLTMPQDVTSAFHRRFGDVTGNEQVGFADFLAFRVAFGQLPAADDFDFDGNGAIDFTDFLQFRNRFGVPLP